MVGWPVAAPVITWDSGASGGGWRPRSLLPRVSRTGQPPPAGGHVVVPINSSQKHLMFVLRSLGVRPTFTSDRYGRTRARSAPFRFRPIRPAMAITEVRRHVHADMTAEASTGTRRRLGHVAAVSVVAAGALLAACSSSSTPATTTAPPGGKLSSSNAAYIAADLKAPSGAPTAAGSTFVQPFFTKAFYTYTCTTGPAGQLLGCGQWRRHHRLPVGIRRLRRL